MNKPWSAQIELTRGCNLRCGFCGTRTMPKDWRFMSYPMAHTVARSLAPFDPLRIEFAMRGEPTLNPMWLPIVQLFRKWLPQSSLMLTTNGIGLTMQDAMAFFRYGGNVLLVDCYGKGTLEERKQAFAALQPIDYYQDGKFNPWHRHGPTARALVLLDDIGRRSGEKPNRTLQNHAGNVDFAAAAAYGITPLDKPLEKICVNPWRELAIHYDGSLHLCCMDFNAEMPLGQIGRMNLSDWWEADPTLSACRALLANGQRNFGICKRCDFNGGGRKGLLPKVPTIEAAGLDAVVKVAEANICPKK